MEVYTSCCVRAHPRVHVWGRCVSSQVVYEGICGGV